MADQIKELESKIAATNEQVAMTPPGPERDEMVDQLNILTNQLAELTFNQEQKAAQIEELVHATDVTFTVAGADFSRFPDEMRAALMQVVELIVKEDRRGIYTQVDADRAADKAKYEELQGMCKVLEDVGGSLRTQVETLQATNIDLVGEYATLKARYEELHDSFDHISEENGSLKFEIKDWQSKHKNATDEIERQKSEIADYQNAKVMGEREAQKIIDVTPEAASDINDAMDKLYTSFKNFGNINVVTKLDGTTEQVKSADLLNGVWKEVPKDAVPSAGESGKDTAVNVGDAGFPNGAVTPPEVNFPDTANVDTEDRGHTADEQVLAENLPFKERFARLEARVSLLEQR